MARFWQFSQLSDNMRGINNLDRVSAAGQLFIGGLRALYQDEPDELRRAGITHILTILDFDVEDLPHLRRYIRHQIQADDFPSQNLLGHFAETNAFIDSVLGRPDVVQRHDDFEDPSSSSKNGAAAEQTGPGVLVHCAMGVSRSATIVCAYLMHKYRLTADQALSRLREARRHCRPNAGFMDQLKTYERMLAACDESTAKEIYEKWLARQKIVYNGQKL